MGPAAYLYAFVVSRARPWMLQDHILRDTSISGMDSDYENALDMVFVVRF